MNIFKFKFFNIIILIQIQKKAQKKQRFFGAEGRRGGSRS